MPNIKPKEPITPLTLKQLKIKRKAPNQQEWGSLAIPVQLSQ